MTSGFSDRALDVFAGFAANMDIDHLSPAADGSISYDIQHAGLLSFTPSGDGARALVSLKRVPEYPQTEELRRFLGLSRWEPYLGLTVNAGMSADGGLVLVAAIDEAGLDLQTLEQCVDLLIALHDSGPAAA